MKTIVIFSSYFETRSGVLNQTHTNTQKRILLLFSVRSQDARGTMTPVKLHSQNRYELSTSYVPGMV
jgi:hypothetical protein